MKRTLIVAMVAPMVMPMASLFAASHASAADLARAGACLLPGRHGLRLGRGYIGINGGYAVGQSEWGSDPRNPSGLSTGNFNVSGGLVGATIGVSGQWGARVFGVEGDFDWQGISGSSSSAFCTSILFPPLLDRPPPD